MLDKNISDQVRGIFASLKSQITFAATSKKDDEKKAGLLEFLNDIASTSEKLSVSFTEKENTQLSFKLLKDGNETGITFRGIPNGHEFTSLLLAVLNTDGQGKNFPDEVIQRRIKSLKGKIVLKTYVSLTCTNCPDVVQALNLMSLINPNIRRRYLPAGNKRPKHTRSTRCVLQQRVVAHRTGRPWHTFARVGRHGGQRNS